MDNDCKPVARKVDFEEEGSYKSLCSFARCCNRSSDYIEKDSKTADRDPLVLVLKDSKFVESFAVRMVDIAAAAAGTGVVVVDDIVGQIVPFCFFF